MKKLFLFITLCLSPVLSVHAQTTVTFNVNLTPMLEDSTFIPGQDVVQVTGNLYPLGRNRAVQMFDEEPVDSIYSATIRFPSRLNNQELEYNFKIVKPETEKTEQLPRKLRLRGQESDLPAIYFNAFAW